MSIDLRKEQIIQHGLEVLQQIGANDICKVCIQSGNSCCRGCKDLKDGIGCQKRNTSCIAWLCGLQKFHLREIGLLDEWESFWNQVPGQCYRRDETPDFVRLKSMMKTDHLSNKSGQIMAERLKQYIEEGGDLEKLESYLYLDFEIRKNSGLKVVK